MYFIGLTPLKKDRIVTVISFYWTSYDVRYVEVKVHYYLLYAFIPLKNMLDSFMNIRSH